MDSSATLFLKSGSPGFSLVELMVVVAIIGILAVIAMPGYQKFQARARQTAAKSELSTIFTAQKSFQGEHGTYHYTLPAIGYVPEGVDMATFSTPAVVGAKRYYASNAGKTGIAPTLATLSLADPSNGNYNPNQGYPSNSELCRVMFDSAATFENKVDFYSAPVFSDYSTFSAVVAGCPRVNLPTEVGIDVWSINQNRVIKNWHDGL